MSIFKNMFGKQSGIKMSTIVAEEAAPIAVLEIPHNWVDSKYKAEKEVKMTEELEKYLREIAFRCVKTQVLWKIRPTINGYNDDPRELFEIPEVCGWAQRFKKYYPTSALWFNLDDTVITLWNVLLLGPVSKEETEKREFQERVLKMQGENASRGWSNFSSLLEEVGIDAGLLQKFSQQIYLEVLKRSMMTQDH